MKTTVSIRADKPNSFAKKNGERVNERLLTCMDLDSDSPIAETFEVVDPEMNMNQPSLAGKRAVLRVVDFVPRQAGVRIIGRVELIAEGQQAPAGK